MSGCTPLTSFGDVPSKTHFQSHCPSRMCLREDKSGHLFISRSVACGRLFGKPTFCGAKDYILRNPTSGRCWSCLRVVISSSCDCAARRQLRCRASAIGHNDGSDAMVRGSVRKQPNDGSCARGRRTISPRRRWSTTGPEDSMFGVAP